MAKYPGLNLRKGGVWYVRKRVPTDLRHVFSNESERKSLETKDKREAVRRYPFKLAEIEAGFNRKRAELREMGAISAALATADLKNLGRREVETLASDWWAKRKVARKDGFSDLHEQSAAILTAREELDLKARAAEEGRDLAADIADRLLVDAGMVSGQHRVGAIGTAILYPVRDQTSDAYVTLKGMIDEALLIEGRLALDHATGKRTAAQHHIFNPDPEVAARPGGGRLTVSDLIARYRAERELRYGIESTDRKYGLLFRVINEFWGPDMPLRAIDRQSVVELKSFIERVPSNGMKKFPNMTLAQSIEAARAGHHKTLAPKTVSTYVQNLRAVLNWAEENDLGVKVNTRGLIVDRGAEVKRRGFEPHELRKLFAELEGLRPLEPWKFWVPALALYTGARAGEICQLHTQDVTSVKGIHCLNLTLFDAEGRRIAEKRLKTKESERYVPIHDELIRAGFLDFVRSREGQVRLFPQWQRSAKGDYSHNMSKWFGRLMDRNDMRDPSLVFHSFRHGFRDACEDADIPDSIADALGGWASVTQGQKYGKRGAVPNLHRAMKRIVYEDFRLAQSTQDSGPTGGQIQPILQPVATVET